MAAQPIGAGEVAVGEAPWVSIELQQRYRYGDYCWDLVDRILADAELHKKIKQGRLWQTPQLLAPDALTVEAELIRKHGKSRQMVRGLHALVATNNIGILVEAGFVSGYGLYPLLSHSDHSCEPTCTLEPGSPSTNELRLVAKRDIRPQEPITWSYFREAEFLPADVGLRNRSLVDLFRFACRCGRCERERPSEIRRSSWILEVHPISRTWTSTGCAAWSHASQPDNLWSHRKL